MAQFSPKQDERNTTNPYQTNSHFDTYQIEHIN